MAATAVAAAAGDFRCICLPGFAGRFCEQDCLATAQVPEPTGLRCVTPDVPGAPGSSSNSSSNGTVADIPLLPEDITIQTCGSSGLRLCNSGEVCASTDDCVDGSECRTFPLLDTKQRCSCPKGSFVVLSANGSPGCLTQAEMCSNGVKDAYEGDVDCGFYCQRGCGLGRQCRGPSGCASGFCAGQRCGCGAGFVAAADGQTCVAATATAATSPAPAAGASSGA